VSARLGSTAKHSVVARDADGNLVVVGSVYSAGKAGQLAEQMRRVGFEIVEAAVPTHSKADFEHARREEAR
jgi:isopropylmalate/homocitrate/citramalate synthase